MTDLNEPSLVRQSSKDTTETDCADVDDEFHDCLPYCNGSSSAASNGMNGNKGEYRTQLPVPMVSRNDFSVWSILKQCIGKELSKITMPVIFNEPLSFVQRVVEYMEYADLLKQASECSDPLRRLELVTAFAVSATASNWQRIGKPFNPLLGETYELQREDLGFRIISEQVSHHPPVSAFHADSPLFSMHGAIHPKLRFWGKSIEVTPKGLITLHLYKHNEIYTWQNVNCCVHNIIVGKIWVEHYGAMEVLSHSTKCKAILNFKPSSWFNKDLHKVEGHIVDSQKRKLRAFHGKWTEAFYSHDVQELEAYQKAVAGSRNSGPAGSGHHHPPSCTGAQAVDDDDDPAPLATKGSSCDLQLSQQTLLWEATPKPHNTSQYYHFTEFAMMLNEHDSQTHKDISPTDSRLRPDMRAMEEGNTDKAGSEKHRLEEKQRTARKDRKKRKEEWRPRWFDFKVNEHTDKEDWMFTGEYWDRDWTRCPDIF